MFSEMMWRVGRMALMAGACAFAWSGRAAAQDELVLYGAGSLREVMTEIAQSFGKTAAIRVRTEFGASGRMRERIEAGDAVDVFTSADIGHARRLVRDGRAVVMAMFARNALCVMAPARSGPLEARTALDRLLQSQAKIAVSPAKIDPLGDYTVELFRVIDRLRPGSEAALASRAVVVDNPPSAPPAKTGDYVLDALNEGRADIAVVYCSGRDRYARLSKDVAFAELPDELQVGPQYGLAVMKSARPEAALLALAILSPEGQATLAKHRFKPIGLPASP